MKDTYRIVKENKDSHLDTVLATDTVTEFTIGEADRRNKDYEKMLKEGEAQISLCQSILKNIERNHPKVLKLSATQRNAARMYAENEDMIREISPKVEQLKAAIEGHKKMRSNVYEMFNWVDELPEDNGSTHTEGEVTIDLNKRGGDAKGAKKDSA